MLKRKYPSEEGGQYKFRRIMGSEPQVAMEGRYGRGPKIKILSEYIEHITFDGLDLSHLYQKSD